MSINTDHIYNVYVCRTCGHIYDETLGDPLFNVKPGTRFDELPEDWFCSACGDPKEFFDLEGPSANSLASSSHNKTSQSKTGSEIVSDKRHVVIIGAGLAGWSVAEKLRKENDDIAISIVTQDSGDYYYKPNLSVAFSKKHERSNLVLMSADARAKELSVTLKKKVIVMGVDKPKNQLLTTVGHIGYSHLVLATGASPIALFKHSVQQHIHHLNDLEQYQELANVLNGEPKKVLIIGAGLIGCEIADDLVRSGHHVVLTDTSNQLMARFLPNICADFMQRRYTKLGIELLLEDQVLSVRKEQNDYDVTFSSGHKLQADLVISAIGLRPRTDMAKRANLNVEKGILVDHKMQTSDDNIYAVGDCAEYAGATYPFVEPIKRQSTALVAAILDNEGEQYKQDWMHITLKSETCPSHTVLKNPMPSQFDEVIRQSDSQCCIVEYRNNETLIGWSACGEFDRQNLIDNELNIGEA